MEEKLIEKPKWEFKTSAGLATATVEQVWPLLEDFCNLHKWLPETLHECYQVEGILGQQPGLTRYCTFSRTLPSSDGHEAVTQTVYAYDRLLWIDPIKRCFSYDMLDNNMGMKTYVATLRLLPINDDDDDDDGKLHACGCKIEWSFVCDPMEGWSFEDFSSFIAASLQTIAKNMEDATSLSS